MEILCPMAPYLQYGSSGVVVTQAQQSRSSRRSSVWVWTHEENKRFENALAEFDEETTDRWEKVASAIPGKTPEEVRRHYQDLEADVTHIEAGLIPMPRYGSPHLTFDWVGSQALDALGRCYVGDRGRRPGGRPCDQERKKGIPWTKDEHTRFLMGLKKYGKGDWRNISRKFVMSRNPTQVASHAQKYFLRLSSSGKDKRRPSIHDITTLDLSDSGPPPIPPCYNTTVGASQLHHNPPPWAAASPVQTGLLFRPPLVNSPPGVCNSQAQIPHSGNPYS